MNTFDSISSLRSAGTAALVFIAGITLSSQEIQKSESSWVARVGEREIPLTSFARRYSDFLLANGMKDTYAARTSILNNMVGEELLLHYDDSPAIRSSEGFRRDVENARKRSILAYLKDKEIYSTIQATEDEARVAFSRAHESLTARHLYARTLEEANELYALLQAGVPFKELAQTAFTDSSLRTNGGFLGSFTWGDMDPAFEDAAYSLKIGEVSQPVRTANGYSIIRLESRAPHPLLTETQFLQKKSHLLTVLRIRKKGPAERAYLSEVFDPKRVWVRDGVPERIATDLTKSTNGPSETGTIHRDEEIVARYGERRYTYEQILSRLQLLAPDQIVRVRDASSVRTGIQALLLQETLLSIAEQKGYDKLEVVLDAANDAERAIYLRARLNEIVAASPIGEGELLAFYRMNLDRFSSERQLNVQEIIVGTESAADSVMEALHGGADFGALAGKVSLRAWSAKNGGVMGLSPVSRFGHFRTTFWNADVGATIGPMKVGDMFGVFRILEKQDDRPIAFEEVCDRVEALLRLEKKGLIVGAYLDDMKKSVGVSIDEQLLRSLSLDNLASVRPSEYGGN